jgi:hypothetical protein
MDLRERPAQPFVRHPWERARRDFVQRLLADHEGLAGVRRVLDVGSGDAWLARELLAQLPSDAQIVCFDAGYEAAALPTPHPRISFERTQPEGRFELLHHLDVLEHVEDDRGFLPKLVRENAHDGSRVLVTVPAWSALMSSHDVMLKHHRRYAPEELLALVRSAGLRPIAKGELFTSLVLPRALTVLKERALRVAGGDANGATPNLGDWAYGERAARVVHAALSLDARVCRAASDAGWRVPGLSTWVLCELS